MTDKRNEKPDTESEKPIKETDPRERVRREELRLKDVFLLHGEQAVTTGQVLAGMMWPDTPKFRFRLVARRNAVRAMVLAEGWALGYDTGSNTWKLTRTDTELISQNAITWLKTMATYANKAGDDGDWLVNTTDEKARRLGEAILDITDAVKDQADKLAR